MTHLPPVASALFQRSQRYFLRQKTDDMEEEGKSRFFHRNHRPSQLQSCASLDTIHIRLLGWIFWSLILMMWQFNAYYKVVAMIVAWFVVFVGHLNGLSQGKTKTIRDFISHEMGVHPFWSRSLKYTKGVVSSKILHLDLAFMRLFEVS